MKTLSLFILCIMFINGEERQDIYSFNEFEDAGNWFIVDDRVMGGISQGTISLNENGNGVYSGKVSTENNGGFSSVRLRFDLREVSEYKAISLKLKGDQKNYQFRIKSTSGQYYSYVNTFQTNGEWEEIRIPFDKFKPEFRGRLLDKPNYPGDVMEEIAFLIGNKKNESFRLEIESISIIK